LLGIAGLEIMALRTTQESYWQSVAATQLAALFERFAANLSNDKREHECQQWQRDIQTLLPAGSATCSCAEHTCRAELNWRTTISHTLKWHADV
jgi:Tfp pilus assembly protein PilV